VEISNWSSLFKMFFASSLHRSAFVFLLPARRIDDIALLSSTRASLLERNQTSLNSLFKAMVRRQERTS
jgi:hypothetical protein